MKKMLTFLDKCWLFFENEYTYIPVGYTSAVRGDIMDKKEQIINSARELFKKFGYKKVSMDEIANASGVTKKTVYSYFKDKDELFAYFVKEELLNMKNIIDKQEKKGKTTFETFHNVIYELIKYKKESEFLNLIANEAENLKTKSAIYFTKKVDESIIEYIKEKLISKIESKEIKECDVDLCSYIIYTVYMSIMFKYSSDSLNEKEISDTLMKILKDGLFN